MTTARRAWKSARLAASAKEERNDGEAALGMAEDHLEKAGALGIRNILSAISS